jgi:hypothetical protein
MFDSLQHIRYCVKGNELVAHYCETRRRRMFAPYCNRHGSRVLLPTSAITALVRGMDGIEAEFICHCGARGVWRADELATVGSPR